MLQALRARAGWPGVALVARLFPLPQLLHVLVGAHGAAAGLQTPEEDAQKHAGALGPFRGGNVCVGTKFPAVASVEGPLTFTAPPDSSVASIHCLMHVGVQALRSSHGSTLLCPLELRRCPRCFNRCSFRPLHRGRPSSHVSRAQDDEPLETGAATQLVLCACRLCCGLLRCPHQA